MKSIFGFLQFFSAKNPLKNPSPLAMQALALAHKLARASNLKTVTGSELLLALIWLPAGGAAAILKQATGSFDQLYEQLKQLAPIVDNLTGAEKIAYGADVREALLLGSKEALADNSRVLETRHLLLGLLQLTEEPLQSTLRDLGLTTNDARRVVARDEIETAEQYTAANAQRVGSA